MLVVAFEVDVRRPARARRARFSTAMCEQPESNQTSRMSVSLRNAVLPHAHGSSWKSDDRALVPGVGAFVAEDAPSTFANSSGDVTGSLHCSQ